MKEMLYEVRCLKSNADMILVLAGQFILSNCPMNLKNSGDSTGFEPITSAMLVQCSNELSYEVQRAFDFKHRTSYNISFIRCFIVFIVILVLNSFRKQGIVF